MNGAMNGASAFAVLGVLLAVSVLGDVIHALLHRWAGSRHRALRWLAARHGAHHRFLPPALVHDDAWLWSSLVQHQLPELAMRLLLTALVAWALGVDDAVRAVAWGACALDLPLVLWRRGRDPWHRGGAARPTHRWLMVDGGYHAMHHAFPRAFLSAHVQVLDRLLGTLLPLERRRVVLMGSSRFVADLHRALDAAGADILRAAEDAVGDDELATAEVLVLGHGAGSRGPCAYEALIARALRARPARLVPLEVWAIGDDDAWRARAPLVGEGRVSLRRLVRAPRLGASVTLALLRRGVVNV